MSNHLMRSRARKLLQPVVAVVAGLALVSVSAVAAHAETPQSATQAEAVVVSQPATEVASAIYSDSDIVGLFLFGLGPIAEKYPALAKKLLPQAPVGATQADVDSITEQLLAAEPAFHEKVTVPLQSHDPYVVQGGIEEFRTAIAAIAQVGVGGPTPQCVVATAVFFAGALAVFVTAVVGAAAVVLYAAVWAYVPSSNGSDFDLQVFSAELARTI